MFPSIGAQDLHLVATHFNEDTHNIYMSLVESIGEEMAGRAIAGLITDLGGDKYQILGREKAWGAVAKGRAADMIAEGASTLEIVRKTGLSHWQVRQLKQQLANADGAAK